MNKMFVGTLLYGLFQVGLGAIIGMTFASYWWSVILVAGVAMVIGAIGFWLIFPTELLDTYDK